MSIASIITSMEDHIKESYRELKGLGIDINVDKNLKNIPILLDNYWETLPKVSGSGTDITLNNTKEGKMKIQLKGNTYQETTTGKNLASLQTSATKTIAGLPFTIENGIFKVNGTASSNGGFYFDSFRANSGTATFTFEITGYTKGGSNNGSVILQVSDDNTTFTNLSQQYFSSASASVQVTLDSTKYYRIRPYFASGNVFSNSTLKIQLEYGNSKTDFEPYTNGASPNPDYPQNIEVVTGNNTIKVQNRNLLNWTLPYSVSSAGNIILNNVPQIEVGQNYYFVGQCSDGTILSNANCSCVWYTGGTQILNKAPNTTFTGVDISNATGFYIYVNSAIVGKTISEFMLVKGTYDASNRPTYIPHREQTYPINLGSLELCKIGTYQDYIYKSGSSWKIHREIGKVTLTGAESESYTKISLAFLYSTALGSTGNTALVNYFTYSSGWSSSSTNYRGKCNIDSDKIRFMPLDDTIDTTEKWKTWLGTHNTNVYYVLATPTEEQITNAELIEQLNNLAYGSSYNGQTNVNSSGNIASLLNANAIQG